MTLDRTTPPAIRQLSEFSISLPERRVMKNGMPLNIINAEQKMLSVLTY